MKTESAIYKGYYFDIEVVDEMQVRCQLMKEKRFLWIRTSSELVGRTLLLMLSERTQNPTLQTTENGISIYTWITPDKVKDFLFGFLISWHHKSVKNEHKKKQLHNIIVKS
jgi:hypothetical protein